MYVTSNYTDGEGTIAKFRSPMISADSNLCFNFYVIIAALQPMTIYTREVGEEAESWPVWTDNGFEYLDWMQGRVPVHKAKDYYVSIHFYISLHVRDIETINFIT
jgi:hypothetical protein